MLRAIIKHFEKGWIYGINDMQKSFRVSLQILSGFLTEWCIFCFTSKKDFEPFSLINQTSAISFYPPKCSFWLSNWSRLCGSWVLTFCFFCREEVMTHLSGAVPGALSPAERSSVRPEVCTKRQISIEWTWVWGLSVQRHEIQILPCDLHTPPGAVVQYCRKKGSPSVNELDGGSQARADQFHSSRTLWNAGYSSGGQNLIKKD